MFKKISNNIDSQLVKLSLVMSLIYCLFFNTAVFLFKFHHYKATIFRAFVELSKDFIYIYLLLFVIFFGLTISRITFIIGSIFLFITGALASYYLYFFKITPTIQIIHSFFGTSINEAHELVSTRILVWLAFSLFTCIYTIKHFKFNDTKLFFTKLLSAICLLISINSIISPPYKLLSSYFPIQYLHNSYLYFSKNIIKSTESKDKININERFTFSDNSPPNIIGVLVIGESARFDHFGINGYERNTTPLLSAVSNLFSFKAMSCSNITYVSVPCFLSRHNVSDILSAGYDDTIFTEIINETSLLSSLTKLGFDTNWIGTQSMLRYFNNLKLHTIYDDVKFTIIPGGSTLFSLNDHDEVMLPYISNMINYNSPKKFLVIHTSGSHWKYDQRYTAEFKNFIPTCGGSDPSSCDLANLINSYDNSILYTDFFLHSVIDLLKDQYAILFYVPDHAESLGEDGRYTHGSEHITAEQTTIPFIIWVSDKLQDLQPQITSAIKSHSNQEINHDYVFHSILDCIGIESNSIDQNLSLCHNKKL